MVPWPAAGSRAPRPDLTRQMTAAGRKTPILMRNLQGDLRADASVFEVTLMGGYYDLGGVYQDSHDANLDASDPAGIPPDGLCIACVVVA